MAWGFIGELPISREQYDRLNAEISEDPEGLILHTAAEHGSGMRIIDVWESEAAYRRFEEETLMPAMGRAGLETPSEEPPPLDSYDVHNLRGPAAP
jgi:heme-degrading monooxygenase HmoA